ncbi:hypothetical protein MW887_005595 [Aspergillus wentii]|nr:hypothetical protein MW887_005595 [Aspergillus wentii]
MALGPVEDNALKQLQPEKSELLDVIDELRTLGFGRLVKPPQLIVCGNRSSGKSSVLEAISRVRFPIERNSCTCFPTEVILRRSPSSRVKVSIEPSKSRSDDQEIQRLREFSSDTFSTGDDLPGLTDKAKGCMGITSSRLTDDILRIEICGPDKPDLTLVDLPGLCNATENNQEISVTRNLTERYMNDYRSVILAIISAGSTYDIQEVLSIAEHFDPKRERTLGVITHTDIPEGNSEEEKAYLQLVNNEKIRLQLGWHALRNRSFCTRNISDDERDELEKEFFSSGAWAAISRELVGLESLRYRLGNILQEHIKRNMPDLVADIEEKISCRQKRLVKLGEERGTVQKERSYLLRIGNNFERTVSNALNGLYTGEFFGGLDPVSLQHDPRRLRAVVRELNDQFADTMHLRGCRRRIVGLDEELEDQSPTRKRQKSYVQGSDESGPILVSKTELEQEIEEKIHENRGIELPGNANQLLVGDLFRDQSKPWEKLAKGHIMAVWESVRCFVGLLLHHLSDDHTCPKLMGTVLDPALEKMKDHLLEKLQELMAYNKRGHPLLFCQQYLGSVEKLQYDQQLALLDERLRTSTETSFAANDVRNLVLETQPSRGHFAAAQIIHLVQAYYKMAMRSFIENIAILGIENCLLHPLESVFTGLTVNDMDDAAIQYLASEHKFVQADRELLRSELDKLQACLRICSRCNIQSFRLPRFDASDAKTSTIQEKGSKKPAQIESNDNSSGTQSKATGFIGFAKWASDGSTGNSPANPQGHFNFGSSQPSKSIFDLPQNFNTANSEQDTIFGKPSFLDASGSLFDTNRAPKSSLFSSPSAGSNFAGKPSSSFIPPSPVKKEDSSSSSKADHTTKPAPSTKGSSTG